MQMSLVKTIGNKKYTFTSIGEDLFELVMEMQHISFQDVYKCGLCASDSLYLRAYETDKDKYQYVKIVCAACGAQLTFGKAKKDGSFFLRKNEDKTLAWEKVEKKEPEE